MVRSRQALHGHNIIIHVHVVPDMTLPWHLQCPRRVILIAMAPGVFDGLSSDCRLCILVPVWVTS